MKEELWCNFCEKDIINWWYEVDLFDPKKRKKLVVKHLCPECSKGVRFTRMCRKVKDFFPAIVYPAKNWLLARERFARIAVKCEGRSSNYCPHDDRYWQRKTGLKKKEWDKLKDSVRAKVISYDNMLQMKVVFRNEE